MGQEQRRNEVGIRVERRFGGRGSVKNSVGPDPIKEKSALEDEDSARQPVPFHAVDCASSVNGRQAFGLNERAHLATAHSSVLVLVLAKPRSGTSLFWKP